jgi:serine/threonine-protein kinase
LQIVRSRQQALAALATPAHLRLASATIGEQFQLEALLFVDELGVVYQGRELGTQRPLWVRVVAGGRDNPTRAAFVAGLRAWQAVQHPSLLPGKAIVEGEDWVAYACAEPDGLTLREWRARRSTWRDLWRTAQRLCGSVAAIHASGLVHGDLHPENVVLSGQSARITRTPLFPPPPGTAFSAYHAPEQLRGQAATARTDIYALGIILYELFLGAHPFVAETEELRLTLQLYSQPQSPRLRWAEIPLQLELFLLRLLALDPADRPANGQAVCDEFNRLPDPTTNVRPPGGTAPLLELDSAPRA